MNVPRQPGGAFDEHRNTSRVWPVPPGSAGTAIDALRNWGDANWAHRQWICDGYPTLTDAEHRARFGASYSVTRRKR